MMELSELPEFRFLVQCEKCMETFSADMDRCPVCGGTEVVEYKVENPFSRLPMERVAPVTGHIVWMIGLVACLMLFWQTNTEDTGRNVIYIMAGFGALIFSLVVSILLFSVGEILKRVIRIQRRVRAFMFDLQQQQKSAKSDGE